MKSLLTPELACYKKDVWPEYGYNPTKAKEELAKSKYATPDKLGKIRIYTGGTTPGYVRTAEIMMESWKTNLGITDVEMKPALDGFGQDQSKVQLYRVSLGAILPDSGNLLKAHHTNLSTSGWSGAKYVDEELAAMIKQLGTTKRDDPNYCALVQKAEAKLLSGYVYPGMIWDIHEFTIKPWVKNFSANTDNGWARILDMYVAKH